MMNTWIILPGRIEKWGKPSKNNYSLNVSEIEYFNKLYEYIEIYLKQVPNSDVYMKFCEGQGV